MTNIIDADYNGIIKVTYGLYNKED